MKSLWLALRSQSILRLVKESPSIRLLIRKSSVGRAKFLARRGEASCAYHGLVGELLDLLDGAGSPLLEGDTVHLIQNKTVSVSVS